MMAFFPCKSFSSCPGSEAELAATQNFSAELPDSVRFFSRYQCGPIGNNPLFRTAFSPRSQLEADLAAASCLHKAIITNDEQSCSGCGVTVKQLKGTVLGVSKAGANATALTLACLGINKVCAFSNTEQSCTADCPGGPNTYTVPAGTFTAPTLAQANLLALNAACANAAICGGVFNTAQSCTIFCPQTNSNITATVAAGIFFGLTQADADAAANAIACALAFLACQAVPPLVGNEVEVCSQECNGATVTYTVPAGAFVSYDQASANLIAFTFCFQVLSQACQEDSLPPDQANVGNSLQSCSAPCPGGGTFTSSVPPGTFRLENLAAANAAAQSYCQSLAQSALFCFPDIAPRVCLESVYAAVVTPTGGTLPRVTLLVAGALPPGILFFDGLIFGIPIVAGVYDFRFASADTEGNVALRDYTLTVAGITTDLLPDGEVGVAYNQVLAQIGFSDPGFFIVGGTLPAGLTLNPSSGAIFGTPTAAGVTSSFVVQIEEASGFSCTKDLSITVPSPSFCANMIWGAPVITPSAPVAGTGSATASQCTFHLESTAPGFPDSSGGNQVVQIDGEQFYTGPAINLNLHLIVSGISGNLSNSDLTIELDGNPLVSISTSDLDTNGTYDYPFTIPISVAAQFTVQTLMIANGAAGPVSGVWDGVISVVP